MIPQIEREHCTFIVDDEDAGLFALLESLGSAAWRAESAPEREEAEALIAEMPSSAVRAEFLLTAVKATDGMEIVRRGKERRSTTRAVVLIQDLPGRLR